MILKKFSWEIAFSSFLSLSLIALTYSFCVTQCTYPFIQRENQSPFQLVTRRNFCNVRRAQKSAMRKFQLLFHELSLFAWRWTETTKYKLCSQLPLARNDLWDVPLDNNRRRWREQHFIKFVPVNFTVLSFSRDRNSQKIFRSFRQKRKTFKFSSRIFLKRLSVVITSEKVCGWKVLNYNVQPTRLLAILNFLHI